MHELVVDVAHIVVGKYLDTLLLYDVAGVDLVFEEKGGHSGDGVTVHHGPVYRGGSAIAGEQRSMEVEGAQRWHRPYYFGQHAESDDYKEIGPEGAQLVDKLGVFESDRL